MITAAEIRKRFLQYFERNGHTIVRSSPLVPKSDPSLLFTNAGMVQFKQVFLGQEQPEYSRATSSQKCLRVGGKHNDLENVGRTARHHTFFEMLGNFSFGDYFKEDAIRFAWDFLTVELGLPKERLYATVFTDDDEAFALWEAIAGLPRERIYRLGEKDNFWSMGDTGPCGPCSEILIDQGEHMACGPECGIGKCECDRYLEVWNLVFMQYNRDETGAMTPLPKPSIDTGMGLERIAAVCQGVNSNFEIDLFTNLFQAMEKMANVRYGKDEEVDTALRVIADHSRAVAFMIADGILPSNEGRGYVLRRLIRRAFRFGRLIGRTEPFLHSVCATVVEEMGESFPELVQSADFMGRVVIQEEERFSETLDKGLMILSEEMDRLKGENKTLIPGPVAFKLYDTFGFPLDIVNDIAEKQGFSVDEPGFQDHMARQKKQSKEAWSGSGEKDLAAQFSSLLKAGVESSFTGYDHLQGRSRIIALLDEQGAPVASLKHQDKGFVITEQTPFYGESGGQTGDRGRITAETGAAEVNDTLKPASKLTVHVVEVIEGEVQADQTVSLHVEEGSRIATARNHTATHLVHAALRKVLGEHVKQAGSQVTAERMRFDFTHIAQVGLDELREVEQEVNRTILADLPVVSETLDYQEALDKGALALFGEKYEDKVRMVAVPGFSAELCGGTHLERTSQAGTFCILSEAGVAAGVRRIEAVTGWRALEYLNERRETVRELAAMVKTPERDVKAKVRDLMDQVKTLTKEKKTLESKLVSAGGTDYISRAENINGLKLLCSRADVSDVRALRSLMDDLRSKIDSGILCLASEADGKVMLILSVSKNLLGTFTAPDLVKAIAEDIGGSGGGRPDLAQAGGSRPEGIDKAFSRLKKIVQEHAG
ncbi:MAG: alanine--tRNA ligase [Desulfovibrionales bacterium]